MIFIENYKQSKSNDITIQVVRSWTPYYLLLDRDKLKEPQNKYYPFYFFKKV